MALKFDVVDRVSTYPGRVILKPVTGATNTYDMERADVPVTEGTPINKALFDSKADTLTKDVTLYVTNTGNDASGDGSVDSPFRTIQAAINTVPKNMGGHTVTIDIEAGTYEERLIINGFSGGRLVIGVYGRSTLVRGIDIDNSSVIVTNISKITYAEGFNGNLFDVDNGSNVLISQGIAIDGTNGGLVGGLEVRSNSVVSVDSNNQMTFTNLFSAIGASRGSTVALARIGGSSVYFGITVGFGSVVSYDTSTLVADVGNEAANGSRIYAGNGTINFATARIE